MTGRNRYVGQADAIAKEGEPSLPENYVRWVQSASALSSDHVMSAEIGMIGALSWRVDAATWDQALRDALSGLDTDGDLTDEVSRGPAPDQPDLFEG